jgi:hypothetical protein
MDPVSISIVAALAAGAAAGAKDVATTAIRDAYASLKRLIGERYRRVEPLVVDMVEADPSSEPEQQVLAKQLSQAGAGTDAELKACAEQLLTAMESLRQEPKAAALFDFERLRAAKNFRLEDIQTIGTIIRWFSCRSASATGRTERRCSIVPLRLGLLASLTKSFPCLRLIPRHFSETRSSNTSTCSGRSHNRVSWSSTASMRLLAGKLIHPSCLLIRHRG